MGRNTSSPKLGILFVPGMHRQVLSAMQPMFFQEALFWVLRNLIGNHSQILFGNGPGSIGRGRSVREYDHLPWVTLASRTIEEGLTKLRERRCDAIVLFGGSLAAIPILHALAKSPTGLSGVVVSPAFPSNSLRLLAWRDQLEESDSTVVYAPTTHKRDLLLIVGERDEVSPTSPCSEYLASFSQIVQFHWKFIADEGHIFSALTSWEQTCQHAVPFFADIIAKTRQ